MDLNILTIILIATVIVSLMAFNDSSLKERLLYFPYDVKRNKNYTRVFGHMLIHADFTHLIFNMMSLYFLGSVFLDVSSQEYVGVDDGLIQTFGNYKGQFYFFLLYLFGGLFSTLIPYVRHQDSPSYKSLGASGAVAAVIFGAILWNPGMSLNLMFIPFGIPAVIFGPLYLAFEFYQDKRGNSGIAHDAHIGGALFGIIFVLIINIDKGKEFFSTLYELCFT